MLSDISIERGKGVGKGRKMNKRLQKRGSDYDKEKELDQADSVDLKLEMSPFSKAD